LKFLKKRQKVINKALQEKKNVFVVGTSTCRALESSVTAEGFAKPNYGWTDKFIFPPYEFKITKKLITNFHQPESTLLMLAAAFAGYDFIIKAYKKGIKRRIQVPQLRRRNAYHLIILMNSGFRIHKMMRKSLFTFHFINRN